MYSEEIPTIRMCPYIERLDFLTDAEVGLDLVPEVHILEQNYPNPFNPTTTIRYRIDASETGFAKVSLIVYDIMGNIVATPVDQEQQAVFIPWTSTAGNFVAGSISQAYGGGEIVRQKNALIK
jgi:hypothetical protein